MRRLKTTFPVEHPFISGFTPYSHTKFPQGNIKMVRIVKYFMLLVPLWGYFINEIAWKNPARRIIDAQERMRADFAARHACRSAAALERKFRFP